MLAVHHGSREINRIFRISDQSTVIVIRSRIPVSSCPGNKLNLDMKRWNGEPARLNPNNCFSNARHFASFLLAFPISCHPPLSFFSVYWSRALFMAYRLATQNEPIKLQNNLDRITGIRFLLASLFLSLIPLVHVFPESQSLISLLYSYATPFFLSFFFIALFTAVDGSSVCAMLIKILCPASKRLIAKMKLVAFDVLLFRQRTSSKVLKIVLYIRRNMHKEKIMCRWEATKHSSQHLVH